MPPSSRDPWLDNVKMVLVTLVVVGHAIGLVEATQGSHWVYDFIYLWHIPAFVFVSGYLSKSFEWDRRRMKSLLYTLAIPYLIFEPALFYYRRTVVGEDVTGLRVQDERFVELDGTDRSALRAEPAGSRERDEIQGLQGGHDRGSIDGR